MTNLTNNTASLEALLTKANALPDKSDGIDTSDATITPETVFLNETGYANGQKVTGTFTIEDEVTAQENLISQIASALEGKAAGGGSAEWVEYSGIEYTVEEIEPGLSENIVDISQINLSDKKMILFFNDYKHTTISIGMMRQSVEDDFVILNANRAASVSGWSITNSSFVFQGDSLTHGTNYTPLYAIVI